MSDKRDEQKQERSTEEREAERHRQQTYNDIASRTSRYVNSDRDVNDGR